MVARANDGPDAAIHSYLGRTRELNFSAFSLQGAAACDTIRRA